MSLSSDKLNGHPTEQDPHPGGDIATIRGLNGWPGAEQARVAKIAAGTPAEQKRRIELAARNRARAIETLRQKKLLDIYEIPQPVKVPGEEGLFSRWLKEKGDRKVRFPNLESFCAYILEHYGDAEKDEQWRDYLAAADPRDEEEERQAAETLAAIDRIDRQVPVKRIDTKDLPPQMVTSPEIAENQIDGMDTG